MSTGDRFETVPPDFHLGDFRFIIPAMPIAIERYWPAKAPGKVDGWVNHSERIEVSEGLLAELVGVSEAEVGDYLVRLEQTTYSFQRDWVVRGNMSKKERIIRDCDILLVALAIGKAGIRFEKAETVLVLERLEGERRIISKFKITPAELIALIESWQAVA